MAELERVLCAVAECLRTGELEPVVGKFPDGMAFRYGLPVVTVGLKAGTEIQGGFSEYLGETLDTETGEIKELYGKRMGLTVELGIYTSTGEEGISVFEKILGSLSKLPGGVQIREISWGETDYDKSTEMYRSCAYCQLAAFLYAESREEQEFLDFNLKGEVK